MTFPDRYLRHAVVLVVAFAGTTTIAVDAIASEPMSVYSVPSKVVLLPDEVNPTHVLISGSFFFLKSTTNMSYSEPVCGTMYFECKPGESSLCRMQWKEIRTKIGVLSCVGFGQKNSISTAMVRPSGAAMGSPFPWDIGMGISTGVYVDGQCPKAVEAQCGASIDGGVTQPLVDGGVDGSAPGGMTGTTSGGPTGTAKGGTTGSTPGTGGTSATTSGRMDAGPELENGKSGCTLAGKNSSGESWLFALVAVGWFLANRRGRARRS